MSVPASDVRYNLTRAYYQNEESKVEARLSHKSFDLAKIIAERIGKQFQLFSDRFTIEVVPIMHTLPGPCCSGPKIVRKLSWTGRVIYKERLIKTFNGLEFEQLDAKPKAIDQILVLEFQYIGFSSTNISQNTKN